LRAAVVALGLVMLAGVPATAADRRVTVDPATPPWSAVAKVQTNIGAHCGGVLIAPAVVLTAAHCLYNPRTRALLEPVSVHVLFGYERAQYRWHRRVVRFAVGPGFEATRRGPPSADWARLELSEAVPVLPLPLFDGGLSAGMMVALAGYNQDRAQLLLADLACQVLRVAASGGGTTLVAHDCEGTRGTSGSPLLARREGGWAVVGINIAAGRDANLAVDAPFER